MDIQWIAGPVIGSVIGYFTNYIAVKMLFRPKKEVKVFGHTLPFTPGAIPKEKPRLARAVGDVVANSLLTKEDIKEQFMGDTIKKTLIDKIMEVLEEKVKDDLVVLTGSEDAVKQVKDKVCTSIVDKVVETAHNIQLGNIIAEESSRIIKEKVSGTMLGMFVKDDMINSLTEPIGGEVEKFVEEKGGSYIEPELRKIISETEETSILEIAEHLDLSKEQIRVMLESLYLKMLEDGAEKMVVSLDIAGLVEDKINAMDVDELEELVLSVMKKELNRIVNLGALIGLVIGILTVFF